MGEAAPRTPRARATRERLVAAAREVFAAMGFTPARVEDIVTEAGVSHGTFYTYFENKTDVLLALCAESAARLLEVASASWEGDDVETALQRVLGDTLAVVEEESDVITVWLEAAAVEPELAALVREVRANFTARVAGNLEPLTAGTPFESQVAAAALVGMVEGYATGRFPHATADERQRAVATLAALWAGALQRLSGVRA